MSFKAELRNRIDDFYKENLSNLLQEKFVKSDGIVIRPKPPFDDEIEELNQQSEQEE